MQRRRLDRERTEAKIRSALGVSLEVDPTEALLQQVWEAAGNVAYLRLRVQELPEEPELEFDEDEEMPPVNKPGIWGYDHLGDQAPHVLIKLYNEERDRLARMAKMAVDSGIAERQVRIAERQGQMFVEVVLAVLAAPELGLSEAKQEAGRRLVGVQLRQVASVPSQLDDGGR